MARTTAQRRRQRAQYQSKLQHYTETSPRVPTRVRSNANEPSGRFATPSGYVTMADYPGYRPASRRGVGWDRPANTNTSLRDGGISCTPRMREGFAGNDIPPTSRVANDRTTKSHKHLVK